MRALVSTRLLAVAVAAAGCGENLTPVADAPPPVVAGCVPDLDGLLTAAELPVVLDQPLTFRVAADVAVDVAGQGAGDQRRWDWSDDRAGDALVDQTAVALDDQWYASAFPGGRFVLAVDDATDGVYTADDRGLYLLGLASRDEVLAGGKTLLPYAAPVAVLRLPLAVGDRWTETGVITGGTARGLPYNGTDTYAVTADADGELHLPYVRFAAAVRVRTVVTSTPAVGGASTTVRQAAFFSECFGEIGRATSRPGEATDDFTTAASQRRLAL
ncbi:MAG: hypothetical protein R3B06_30615 [Kofleriaceae bacterium]